jgi:hypothetical protein
MGDYLDRALFAVNTLNLIFLTGLAAAVRVRENARRVARLPYMEARLQVSRCTFRTKKRFASLRSYREPRQHLQVGDDLVRPKH